MDGDPQANGQTPVRGATRRRLDVAERRAEIISAARELFATAPYEQVSTADISRASGGSQALVFHYFGTKAGLYAAVVQQALDELAQAQREAAAALPDGVPVRDRVRAMLETHLDQLASQPRAGVSGLAGGVEPEAAVAVRDAAREQQVATLAELLGVHGWARHDYALAGFVGFVDHACLRWAGGGCHPDERGPLVEAALGALEGALGDWRV